MNDKLSYEHYVTYGKILNFEEYYIDGNIKWISVLDADTNTTYKVWQDLVFESNLYVGEEIAVIHHVWHTPFDSQFVIEGIIDKNRYDNTVRDSQKIPKGWICEPKVEYVEDFGIMANDTTKESAFGSLQFGFRPNNDPKKLYSVGDYCLIGNFTNGEEAVAQTYYITKPNGETTTVKQIISKKKYDERLSKNQNRM